MRADLAPPARLHRGGASWHPGVARRPPVERARPSECPSQVPGRLGGQPGGHGPPGETPGACPMNSRGLAPWPRMSSPGPARGRPRTAMELRQKPQSRSGTLCDHKRRLHLNGAIAHDGLVPPRCEQLTPRSAAFEGVACETMLRSYHAEATRSPTRQASAQAWLVVGSACPDRHAQLVTVAARHHLQRDRARRDRGDLARQLQRSRISDRSDQVAMTYHGMCPAAGRRRQGSFKTP